MDAHEPNVKCRCDATVTKAGDDSITGSGQGVDELLFIFRVLVCSYDISTMYLRTYDSHTASSEFRVQPSKRELEINFKCIDV